MVRKRKRGGNRKNGVATYRFQNERLWSEVLIRSSRVYFMMHLHLENPKRALGLGLPLAWMSGRWLYAALLTNRQESKGQFPGVLGWRLWFRVPSMTWLALVPQPAEQIFRLKVGQCFLWFIFGRSHMGLMNVSLAFRFYNIWLYWPVSKQDQGWRWYPCLGTIQWLAPRGQPFSSYYMCLWGRGAKRKKMTTATEVAQSFASFWYNGSFIGPNLSQGWGWAGAANEAYIMKWL